MKSATVTTHTLRDLMRRDDVTLIDIRSPDAYNGWRLGGEPRGGHIPRARSLPARWTTYIDWLDIVRAKGIERGRPLVLYGYASDDIESVAGLFRRAGFEDVRIYPHFTEEWSPRNELSLDRLARHTHLVPNDWVSARMARRDAVLCHCHYDNPGDYAQGHIPGAIALNTLALESPETWNRRSPEELQANLEKHGITRASTVIVYGRYSSPAPDDPFPGQSAGHLGAIRCAVLMLYAGVRDVRVLNGGLQTWRDAQLPLTTEPTAPTSAPAFGCRVPANPHIMIDTPEVKTLLASRDGRLVSMRSRPEYEGKVSGYNYIEAKGRIPGEVFGNCGQDAYHMDNYRNPDHTTLEYPQIAAALRAVGIGPEQRVAFYCGTGWRASEAFYNTWLMGWPQIAVYDGGWFEWSRDPANPTETGMPT